MPGFKREYREILEEIKTGDTVVNPTEDEENMEKEIRRENREETREEQAEVERERVSNYRHQRKRTATCSWESFVQPAKRGRGRPKILRTGSAGRPRKLYASAENNRGSDEKQQTTDQEAGEGESEIDDDVFVEQANLTAMDNPETWKEASETEDVDAWRGALEDEFLAQIKNNTWDIVERPNTHKVIGSRFVFCTKNNGKNNVQKKKVRLVAKDAHKNLVRILVKLIHRVPDQHRYD